MAKSNWLKHVTNTYKLLKQSNPEAKLKDAMRLASKTFRKVSSVVRDYIPEKKGKTTRRKRLGKKGRKGRKGKTSRTRKYRGGEAEAEDFLIKEESETV